MLAVAASVCFSLKIINEYFSALTPKNRAWCNIPNQWSGGSLPSPKKKIYGNWPNSLDFLYLLVVVIKLMFTPADRAWLPIKLGSHPHIGLAPKNANV